MTTEDFKLDTSNMTKAAEYCKTLSNEMIEMRRMMEQREIDMVNSWIGEGSAAFQKKFHVIMQQLKDLKDELTVIAEDILTAQESYIHTDVETAKALDGIQEIGTGKEQRRQS